MEDYDNLRLDLYREIAKQVGYNGWSNESRGPQNRGGSIRESLRVSTPKIFEDQNDIDKILREEGF